jgi:hypothetical protein
VRVADKKDESLAYAEIFHVAAAMFQRFEFELYETDFSDLELTFSCLYQSWIRGCKDQGYLRCFLKESHVLLYSILKEIFLLLTPSQTTSGFIILPLKSTKLK